MIRVVGVFRYGIDSPFLNSLLLHCSLSTASFHPKRFYESICLALEGVLGGHGFAIVLVTVYDSMTSVPFDGWMD
jgi:hypothetical protein